MMNRRHWIAAAALPLAGCAGYHHGWRSVAYLGETPPPENPPLHGLPPEFVLPGLALRVDLGNRLQTSDRTVMLFVVPSGFDPRDRFVGDHVAGRARVYVEVRPLRPDLVFRPSAAVLVVGDRRVTGAAGHEFGPWNATGERVEQGGRWAHVPRPDGYAIGAPSRPRSLSIDFAVDTPSPQRADLALELAGAIDAPGLPPLPRVRFAPRRWEEGYT